MKKFKSVLSLLVVVTVLFAFATTAFAAGEGSITVNGTTVDKTYDAYKIFDLTYSGSGSSVTASYTIDEDWVAFFNSEKGSAYIVGTDDTGALNPIVVDGTNKYINITNDNINAFAKDALAYAATKQPDDSKTASGTSVTFGNLALGYYLIYPEGATEVSENYASICSITSTVPNGTVNVKATYPVIEKEVDDETVDIGQTVTYTVSGKVPDTTGFETYTYTVKDTLSAGLTFNESVANLTVAIDGTVIDNPSVVYADNGFELSINMKNYQDKIGADVVITYSAVVNEDAVNGAEGNPNSATLTYSNDPKDSTSTSTTPPEIVKVYTAGIEVFKYAQEGDEKKPLENAQFILMDNNGLYYKFTPATGTSSELVEWVTEKDNATVMTTDANGNVLFKGLESGAYKIVEIKAPDGYNLLTEPVEVSINHTSQNATTYQALEIENKTGSVLPETGGIGTQIFYVIGSMLIIGAGVLFITKKRMSSNKG